MRKYQWLFIVALIGCAVLFPSCDRAQDMLDPVISEPKPPEVTEPTSPEVVQIDLTDPNALPNRLTVQGATLVSAQRPETSTAATAPSIQADVENINATPGDTVNLPFTYSGTNTLGGCIVCIEGVPGYYDLPYTDADDALPTAIPVGISPNIGLGSFTVCYSVYDNQGQYANYLTAVITVAEPEVVEPSTETEPEPPIGPADVLIYTNRSFWITLEDAAMAAETTKSLLESKGIQVEITKNDAYIRNWMLQTPGDGNVNVVIFYGVLPASIYGTGNTQPDGSIAENWIETTDGDTILNHADYIAYNTDYDVDKVTEWTPDANIQGVGSSQEGGLQNLMDNPNINIGVNVFHEQGALVIVTTDGKALTPSLVDFESYRPIPLNQLQGEWYAEKVFASDTGDAQAAYADPVIVRDGNRGRFAVVHATFDHEGLLNGEVAAEIIINYLLAE